MSPPPAPARRRSRRRLLLTLACLLAGPFLAEGILRALLFSDLAPVRRLGEPLRHPGYFADHLYDDAYWKLHYLWRNGNPDAVHYLYDHVLGWRSPELEAGTLAHRDFDEEALAGRRLVLFYGASYAACDTSPETCYQGLMASGELADAYVLLNHSVHGYGLDQTLLLLRATLDRYQHLDPVVVLAPVVQADVQRSLLGIFSWPKPRFVPTEDALALLPPSAVGLARFVEEEPLAIRSYLWRHFLVRDTELLRRQRERWLGRPDQRRELKLVTERLLASFEAELDRRGLDHFALLLHTEHSLRPGNAPGRNTEMVQAALRAAGTPFVTVRREVEGGIEAGEFALADLFFQGPPKNGHPNEFGNEVFFRTLRRGLAGTFDE